MYLSRSFLLLYFCLICLFISGTRREEVESSFSCRWVIVFVIVVTSIYDSLVQGHGVTV